MSKKFYFIAMYQDDMFKNQVLEEIFRERKTHYIVKKREINFWIVISPNFLNFIEIKEKFLKTNYYRNLNFKSEKKNIASFSCIISTNKEFIQWIKLRLGHFENIKLINETRDQKNYDKFCQSDGMYGEIDNSFSYNYNPLDSNNNNIDDNMLVDKILTLIKNLSVY